MHAEQPRLPQLASCAQQHPCLHSPWAYRLNQSANSHCRVRVGLCSWLSWTRWGFPPVPSFCPLYLLKTIKPQPSELMQSPCLVMSDVARLIQQACFVTVSRGCPSTATPALVLGRQGQSSHSSPGCAVCKPLWGQLACINRF